MTKQTNSRRQYTLKANLLKAKYQEIAKDFKSYNDDRGLVPNKLKQLLDACEIMRDIDNAFICVAFNNRFTEKEAEMAEIVTRFTGKVWKNYEWVDKNE